MWTPITTSGNYYTAYAATEKQRSAETKQVPPQRTQTVEPEEKKSVSQTNKKAQQKTAPAKKKVKSKKSDSGQNERISEAIPSDNIRKKKSTKTSSSSSANAKKNKGIKKAEDRTVRSVAKQREKTNKAFLRLVRNGKSVDEARIIITKRKLRKRKLGMLCSVLFLFFFATLFLVSYTYCEGAEISNILIDGDAVYTNDEILTAANISEGMNMLTIREKELNDKVTTALPFISVVGLEYNLPDTLKLNITSTNERLIIKSGSKYICIDKTGKVVSEKKKKLQKGQYLVIGLEEQEYTVGQMFAASEKNKIKYDIAHSVAFAADGNEIINTGTIDVSNVKDITLTYKSRLRVYLGSDDNLQSKLTKAESVMIDNKAQNKTGYINAKYDVAAYFMQGSMQA